MYNRPRLERFGTMRELTQFFHFKPWKKKKKGPPNTNTDRS